MNPATTPTARLGLALLALTALLALGASASAKDGPKEDDHVAWRATYRDALLEARLRNVPVLVSRHKDECSRCDRMYRGVFRNEDFVRWAREHVVAFVAHNQMGHDEVETKGADGATTKTCPLYPGIRCRDHVDAAVDVDNARGDDLVKVPFLELCPNTWLVSPTGEVTQVSEEEQFVAGKIRDRVEALQKTLGEAQPVKALPVLRELLEKADEDLDENRFGPGLARLAELEAKVKPPHASLKALLEARLRAVEESVLYDFEDARDDKRLSAEEKRARIRKLRDAVDVPVLGKRVPSHAAMSAWLGS